MNCENLRNDIDNAADSRKPLDREGLSPEMRSHLEKCPACARYFESALSAGHAMINSQHVEIPAELYDRLVRLENRDRATDAPAFGRFPIAYILKIILPATLVWIIGMFMPAPTSILVEILLMIFAMVLAFEKIGRRLVTDRV
jgi:uncharacterized membrane protein